MRKKVLFSWSGGKDSALAFYEIKNNLDYEIVSLLTTVTEDYDRVSMHGIRSVLLEQQAESLGLHLESVFITKEASQKNYESAMFDILKKYKNFGVASVVFGDIFLEDVKKYREKNLAKMGMKAIFPLWRNDTFERASAFVRLGFKAIITCVDSNVLDKNFVGRIFDEQFLSELPSNIDPCGENGEFHSFVYDGPIFRDRIPYKIGEICLRDSRFYFCDIIPL
jgi:uncharacterized protein (TIGR00290 family)